MPRLLPLLLLVAAAMSACEARSGPGLRLLSSKQGPGGGLQPADATSLVGLWSLKEGTQSIFSPDVASVGAVEQVTATGKLNPTELFAQAFNMSNLAQIPDFPASAVYFFESTPLLVAIYGVDPRSGIWAGAMAVKNETGGVIFASALMGRARASGAGAGRTLELWGSDGTPAVSVEGQFGGDSLNLAVESKQGNMVTGANPQDSLSYILQAEYEKVEDSPDELLLEIAEWSIAMQDDPMDNM